MSLRSNLNLPDVQRHFDFIWRSGSALIRSELVSLRAAMGLRSAVHLPCDVSDAGCYSFECVCGARIVSANPKGECWDCKRKYEVAATTAAAGATGATVVTEGQKS